MKYDGGHEQNCAFPTQARTRFVENPHTAAWSVEAPFYMAEPLEPLESPLCYDGRIVWFLCGGLLGGPWTNQFK